MNDRSAPMTFPWDEKLYVTAGEIVFRYKMAYSYWKYVGYFFVALIPFGLLHVIDKGSYSLLYLGTILSIYWYIVRRYMHTVRLKKHFKKEPVSKSKMVFQIGKKGMRINGNMIPWDHFTAVIVHPKGFLLERPEGYPYLPATAFADDEAVEAFMDILAQRDIPIRMVK